MDLRYLMHLVLFIFLQLFTDHKEMIEEYNSLPVSKDTLRIRQKKEDIERKLIKVEEGIRILSKAKVFVRTEE